jgi:hypothetical protein
MSRRSPDANASEDAGQIRVRRRDRLLAWGFTAGVHLTVFAALFWPRGGSPPPPAKPELSLVTVSTLPKPAGPSKEAEPGGQGDALEPTMLRPTAPAAVPVTIIMPDNSDLLSDSQIAGAASVGEGGGGGGCDLARAVQSALRRDRRVRMAVEEARRLGKAIMLWNGDWVRSSGQDGKGLSVVRQAIVWEVAFSPEACRNERVHGLVLLSLQDGATRFAIGAGDWRWSDLLGLRRPSSR